MRGFTAVIERCPDTGLYVGYVPGFPGAHSQAESLDELHRNLGEVIEMLLEDGEPRLEAEFGGWIASEALITASDSGGRWLQIQSRLTKEFKIISVYCSDSVTLIFLRETVANLSDDYWRPFSTMSH
jgi:predicted RNase H-like HicB family nuclease